MSYFPKGKYVHTNNDFPEALGICDYTGFRFNHNDLVKQMEWRGNALVWTGFMVGRPFVDVPNEQARPPILPPDPVPVRLPRPPKPTVYTWATANFNTFGGDTINQFSDTFGIFDGTPALPPVQRSQALNTFNWSVA